MYFFFPTPITFPSLYTLAKASLSGSKVKASTHNAEIWVQSLGQEDPLKKEMETHSSTLAWRIPWVEEEEPGKLQSMGSQRVGQD